jgi:transposase
MVAQPEFPRYHLTLAPTLFVGIDVAKKSHIAGFVSPELLRQKRFDQCPTLSFENSQAGITKFLARVQEYVPLARCAVLMESTGHYHRALCEQLIARGLSVYIVAVRSKRLTALAKTDRIDALRLANSLYAQLALGFQPSEKSQLIRQLAPATDAALQLQHYIQRRYEVVQSSTRTKNKLTAICDEIFPELTQVFKDPNGATALEIRYRWPTPAAVAAASIAELCAVRSGRGTSKRKFEQLQDAAKTSIGITTPARLEALIFEQEQLIEALWLLQSQLEALERKITTLVEESREGQILLSMDCMGPIMAATLLASIGNIRNFSSKAELRKFCGWAPQDTQTGTSINRARLTPTGSRPLKQILYLLASSAVNNEHTVWHALYERLLPQKCPKDPKTQEYTGRMRVIARVAGQMIGVIYALLKYDADLIDSLPEHQSPPAPQLYDREIHRGSRSRQTL